MVYITYIIVSDKIHALLP